MRDITFNFFLYTTTNCFHKHILASHLHHRCRRGKGKGKGGKGKWEWNKFHPYIVSKILNLFMYACPLILCHSSQHIYDPCTKGSCSVQGHIFPLREVESCSVSRLNCLQDSAFTSLTFFYPSRLLGSTGILY